MFNKLSRNVFCKRGFTLVEIMIVVAVIGILAAVLIPGAIKMKEEAKTSGIDTNIRTMMAVAENAIDDSTPVSIGASLEAKAEAQLKNPVNKSTTATVVTALSNANITAAQSFVYVYDAVTGPVVDAQTAKDNVVAAVAGMAAANREYLKGSVIAVPIGTGAAGTAVLTQVVFMGIGADGLVSTSDSKLAVYTVKK